MTYLRGRGGFTLIELLVVIAIITILAAILFPVFSQMKERGKRAGCLSNLRQIAMALHAYADEYDGRFPSANFNTPAQNPRNWSPYGWAFWSYAIQPYCKSWHLFLCPSSPHYKPTPQGTGQAPICTYGMNEYLARAEQSWSQYTIPRPSDLALVADCMSTGFSITGGMLGILTPTVGKRISGEAISYRAECCE